MWNELIKADKELRANIEEWNQQKIGNFCIQKGIKWIFNSHGRCLGAHNGDHYQRWWKQVRYLINLFWTRWIKEYLQTRQKWMERKKNLKVGDIILLMDENDRRGQWPLARVVEVFPSEDGLVRSVKVKTSSTVVTQAKRARYEEIKTTMTYLTRPLTKLCGFEMDHDNK